MITMRLFCLLLILWALTACGWCQNQEAAPPADQQARIARLIEQLGAADYSLREKAQSELVEIGLEAFDALSEAQHHEDIEIALRARFLVRSMQVKWHEDSDSPQVVAILRSYGELSELERKSRIDQLRPLGQEGIYALCRLARYEVSDELSKTAALHVLNSPAIADEQARAEAARRIAAIAGAGKRTAAAWLRTYAKTLGDVESAMPQWDAHAKAEHELLAQYPERTSREIVRDLYRYEVALLQQSHKPERAVDVIRQSLALMEGTPEQLAEIVAWLIHREVWSVVEEVAGRFPQAFVEHPKLQYLRAEAFLKQKQSDRAKELAERALAASGDKLDERRVVAEELQQRGMFDWAERELRTIISRAEAGSDNDLRARSALAEMLHDMGRELPAAEALQGFVDAIDQDMAARDRAAQFRNLESVRSRLHYFYALDLLEKKNVAGAAEHLDRGVQSDPTDADVLIALYRLPDQSDERRKQTLNLINAAVSKFREQINEGKLLVERELDEAAKSRFNPYLANAYNQYAWLVSNTIGDYDEALEFSIKSNELMPKYAAYLDTLGRCYFAKKDFDNAIRYQKLALEHEPHSGQMQRQLALFIKERDARQGTEPGK